MVNIVILNHKGGCGKTTTAINLGSYLALAGHRTLIVDLDPQGASTVSFGIDKRKLEKTIYDVMISGNPIESIIQDTGVDNLSIAPTNIHLSGAELELVSRIGRESILTRILEPLTGYEYILIDTPPTLGLLTLNSLVASSHIIVPIQAEYFALEGMSQLLDVVNKIRDHLGHDLERRYLLTMVDGRTKLSAAVTTQVKDYFGSEVFETAIPRSVRLAEAPSYGRPVAIHDPESTGAQAYQKLAEEVLQWTGK